jgi:hypothetical protein
MPKQRLGDARRQKLVFSLLLVFVSAAVAVFALSLLPWFRYLRPSPEDNPYDLVALEKMPETERERTVDRWVEEFRALSEEEKADRADQYMDSMVNYLEEKLDLGRGQAVETKSLIKGGALVARQSGLREERGPRREEGFRELRNQIQSQLESILTPDQRGKLQQIVDERERIGRERRERFERAREP